MARGGFSSLCTQKSDTTQEGDHLALSVSDLEFQTLQNVLVSRY